MRKLIASLHVTLDGFVGGPNGEMDWVKLDDEMFDFVATLTGEADTALYGRVTYEMMKAYWPTAADQPNATKHDIEHSTWYNKVDKIVASRTMKDKDANKTYFISDAITDEVSNLKRQEGKNILIFGSPSVVRSLMQENLIDEYWLFVNPVILGEGISMVGKPAERISLKLAANKVFPCGVVGMNYVVR